MGIITMVKIYSRNYHFLLYHVF